MKPKTASKFLSIAFEECDEDAVRIASQENPWDLIDHSNDRSFQFNPIYTTIHKLDSARSSRDGSLDEMRKVTANCLLIMVDHGYRPKLDQLGRLAKADIYVFTKMLRSLVKLKEPLHPYLFHYFMGSSSPASAISKACLKIGFDPNGLDAAGNTPLHAMWEKAILSNPMGNQHSESALWWEHTARLIEAGAKLYASNHRGSTVLEMIQHAINRGAPGGVEKMAWVAEAHAQQLNALTPRSSLSPQCRRL